MAPALSEKDMNVDEIRKRHEEDEDLLNQSISIPPLTGKRQYQKDRAALLAEVERLQDICERQLERMIRAGIADNSYTVDFYFKARAETAESNLPRLVGMFKCPDNPGGFHNWDGDGKCLDCCNYATDLSDATLKAYRTTADRNVSDRLIETEQEKRNDQ